MMTYYIGNRYDGCYYVRCYLPLLHNGWDGTKVSLQSQYADPQRMAQGALNADVVVFQRPDDPQRLESAKKLQEAGKIIVFDNDDTYIPNSGVPTTMGSIHGEERLKEMNNTLMEFVKMADVVTTTTETLKKEYSQYNDNVVILPNMVDPDDWERVENDTGKVRIGLVGSVVSNKADFWPIKDTIKKLCKNEKVQVVVFGLPPDDPRYAITRDVFKEEIEFWSNLDIEWQPFVPMHEYFDTLADLKLDIMLIPRDNSYFNKCKSNLKYLEASMLKIPVIASSFEDSPYEELDGVNGIKLKNHEDWYAETMKLVNHKHLREQIGNVAYDYVLKNYNIHNKAHMWADTYKLCQK